MLFSSMVLARFAVAGFYASLLVCRADPAITLDAQDIGDKPFRRYIYTASPGKPITFYLSKERNAGRRLPLIVWIQGTGCASHFARDGGQITSGLQSVLYSVVSDRARVLTVEKPGVQFLDDPQNPGDARNCRPEFRAEFTLDSWAAGIAAAIKVANGLEGIDASKTLVVGHSEGAIVAARVSNVLRAVTHVAALSGGGPVYLFHIAEDVRNRGLDAEKEVYRCWEKVLRDPENTAKFCWGQSYRNWSSFMKTSIITEALMSPAQMFFAHGTADEQNTIAGFDMLRAELTAKGRKAVFERIEGADHALGLPNQPVPTGLEAAFRRVADWFFADPHFNVTTNSK